MRNYFSLPSTPTMTIDLDCWALEALGLFDWSNLNMEVHHEGWFI